MIINGSTVTAMSCAEFQRSFEPYLDGEFEELEQAEAELHLQGCAACQRLAEAQGRLRAALRAHLREAMGPGSRAGRAPAALRARLQAALEHERRPLWRRFVAPMPLATAAACAAGLLVVVATHGRSPQLVEEAVRSYHRDLPLEVTTASVAPEAIPGWFAGKLDFKPTPPRFAAQQARVVGARLSHLRELPAAYIKYELPRGRQAGLFIVDDPDGRVDGGGRDVELGARHVKVLNSRGYNTVTWRQDKTVYSLVSDQAEDDLIQLVRDTPRER